MRLLSFFFLIAEGLTCRSHHLTSHDPEAEETPVPPVLAMAANQCASNQPDAHLEAFQTSFPIPPNNSRPAIVCPPATTPSNCLPKKPLRLSIPLLSLFRFSTYAIMLSRSSFSRNAPRALQKQCSVTSRRGMASATTPGLQYEVSDSAGVKIANREIEGPTGTLALVAKAGSRYQPFPGFSEALAQFAFQVGSQCPMALFCRLYISGG